MKILITGAASGIGYLTALTLALRGHFVYLTCHTKKQVDIIKKRVGNNKNIEIKKIDITKEEDRKKILNLNIDCLYNNAGIALGGSIIEADMDDVRTNFEVNVFSSFRLLQLVLRQMIEKDKGRIAVMSSLISSFSIPFTGIYAATKSSITSIIKALQKELFLMGTNVKVILIEPGLYHTGFNQKLLDSKYNNGKYFNDIKKELHKIEHFWLKLFEKKSLDSIVVQIIRAIEDKYPKKIYKAPFLQSTLVKICSIFR